MNATATYHSTHTDSSSWRICEYRHCARPLPPGLIYCPSKGRRCYQSERWERRRTALEEKPE